MKVLVLSDDLWALAKRKIERELDCSKTEVEFCRGVRRRFPGTRHWNEPWARKRHIEAIRLAKILNA